MYKSDNPQVISYYLIAQLSRPFILLLQNGKPYTLYGQNK